MAIGKDALGSIPTKPINRLISSGADSTEYRAMVTEARLRLLRMHAEARVGHIGGNLSCLDILLSLYHHLLGAADEFVLSKGHAAGALYVALWSVGRLTDDDLSTFHKEGTRLAGHPAANCLPDIAFASGSLGHGLSLASGMALAKKLKREDGRVYCLLSDAEWQEGSTWEALIFACRHELAITIIVDLNGLQGFGTTAEVAGMSDLTAKIRGFCPALVEVDGHDATAIEEACHVHAAHPQVIVARTVKGAGVSYMEHQMAWHYLPMSAEQYEQACREIRESRFSANGPGGCS
jgi:transketolase